MSSIYIQEPPTEGKVLLTTSAGDLDIELWSKEAPKACRNFVQLCMEGYYNNTIFHRVVKGFIVQGGDPTGTGTSGESIYGKPFKDEVHSRLRFARRGLVAMANAGKNDNGSQFFFTLGEAPELQDKHTIFGKVVGNTIYNLPRFEEGSIDSDERPEYPHKITKTEILKNPFNDIVPRLKIENEVIKEKKKKKKGTKNFKLLSFGDEAEGDEEELTHANEQLPITGNSAHDISADPKLSSVEVETDTGNVLDNIKKKLSKAQLDTQKLIEEDAKLKKLEESEIDPKTQKRLEVQAEIRSLKRAITGKTTAPEEDKVEENPKKPKLSAAAEEYIQDNKMYADEEKPIPKKGSSRETETLKMLEKFTTKVRQVREDENCSDQQEDSWLAHKIVFNEDEPVQAKDANLKDDTWYDLNDPRHPHNKQRRDRAGKKSK